VQRCILPIVSCNRRRATTLLCSDRLQTADSVPGCSPAVPLSANTNNAKCTATLSIGATCQNNQHGQCSNTNNNQVNCIGSMCKKVRENCLVSGRRPDPWSNCGCRDRLCCRSATTRAAASSALQTPPLTPARTPTGAALGTLCVVPLCVWCHSVCGATLCVVSLCVWCHSVCGVTLCVVSLCVWCLCC
jgi:hypothetical protein